ncbi:MAG: 23S rRNA (adenine(2503)-C(2))-methyltransferase RlmN [Chloroflexota bacterium]
MDAAQRVYDLDFSQIESIMEHWGEPRYRAEQIWNGLYVQLWEEAGQFTNLPKALRSRLESQFLFGGLQLKNRLETKDGSTQKTLYRLADGQSIETVLMHYQRRHTVCISSQVGCALGCSFCATGQMGFQRNLSSGEIVEQVIRAARSLQPEGKRLTNVVMMGMGEPFHNYQAVMAAIERLGHPLGFNLGARRLTISTVGIVPAIRQFANEHRQENLAISLHAAEDGLRSSLLPINKKYPLRLLMEACKEYVHKTNRRITFEWALIKGANDSPDHAIQLARLVDGMLCHVNVIPLNPTKGYEGEATTSQRAILFQEALQKRGISCTIRTRRGIEIWAGCGQLAT